MLCNMESSDKADRLSSRVSRAIMKQLTTALEMASVDQLAHPMLRIEAFVQDGDGRQDGGRMAGNPPSHVQLVA